jgi:hypothetical protein
MSWSTSGDLDCAKDERRIARFTMIDNDRDDRRDQEENEHDLA